MRCDCQELSNFLCVRALAIQFYRGGRWKFFSYFMNNRIQTDLPLKDNSYLINKWNINWYSVFRMDLFEKW